LPDPKEGELSSETEESFQILSFETDDTVY